MYDQKYVKKRKRRKLAAFLALFTAIAATSLIIVSYLGRTVGTFTVAVTNSSVKLALSKSVDLKDTTSYLRVDKLYPMRETTFTNIEAKGFDTIDDESTDYDYGFNYKDETPDSMYFVKYTFYVTNLSDTIAKYNLNVKLGDRNISTDGTKRGLDDTLRVMLFENDPINDDGHKYTVYAKEAAEYNRDVEGNKTRREFISTYPSGSNQEDDEHKLAESFLPGQTIVKSTVSNFKKGDIRRYTLVIWLEGEDPQSDNSKEIPEGASLKLGVDIAAYEND